MEINKLRRKPENEFGHMLPYYELEENIQEEKTVQLESCCKCDTDINPDNYNKNKTIRRKCRNENMRKRRNMYT